MEPSPSLTPITFEITYLSPSLNVGMRVFNTTTGSPVLVQGPTAMTNVPGTNTYIGQFTPQPNSNYLISKAVYTDGTLTTIDNSFAQGSETITTQPLNANGGSGGSGSNIGCEIVGYVQPSNTVIGYVEC